MPRQRASVRGTQHDSRGRELDAEHGPVGEQRAIADAQVQAAAAAVTVLERRLDKMVLRAPADGVVSVIAAEVGENVRAGQPILTVQSMRQVWVTVPVPEEVSRKIYIGLPTQVRFDALPGRTFTGKSTLVAAPSPKVSGSSLCDA